MKERSIEKKAPAQSLEPDCPQGSAESKQPEQMKKSKRGLAWLAGALAALLLAAGLYWIGRPLDGQPTARQMKRVILTGGERQLRNIDFSYYYWSEYFYFINQNAAGGVFTPTDPMLHPLDTAKPLDEQTYDGKVSWQYYMVDRTLGTIRKTVALCRAAERENFAMDEKFTDSMENILENFTQAAVEGGFTDQEGDADLDAYLRDSYGPGADTASFRWYLHDSCLAAAYSDYLYEAPVFTDQQLSDYYDSQNYEKDLGVKKSDSPVRTARVIAIAPEGSAQADWDKAYETWQSILTTWHSQGDGEEDFATLAVTYSDDSDTAPTGGLLEDVYPGQLEGQLDEWLFDGSRKAGDAAVLKLETEYQIVYLSSISDEVYWKTVAEEDLRFETCQNAILELEADCRFQVDTEHIVIAVPKDLYSGQ